MQCLPRSSSHQGPLSFNVTLLPPVSTGEEGGRGAQDAIQKGGGNIEDEEKAETARHRRFVDKKRDTGEKCMGRDRSTKSTRDSAQHQEIGGEGGGNKEEETRRGETEEGRRQGGDKKERRRREEKRGRDKWGRGRREEKRGRGKWGHKRRRDEEEK